MSDQNLANVMPIPFSAGAAIAINRFVKFDTTADRQVIQAAAAADVAIGVSMEAGTVAGGANPNIGVQMFGIAKVTAGAALTRGAMVTSDATGRAVTAATGNNTHGVALTSAGAAGDVIEVALHTPNTNGPTTP